ncbi:capsular polysaccharide biosynthesis protein [Loktanella sp. D2R18]|uniref:capsular polysaccharide biosynthesis protein n=1 Tax=Rhodobacterales TaxID=204455 RepID=UPI000DE9A8F1|nr:MULTISPECIES: capsular polysaccharide biosynthesis protein [Rhodobacterales]MDO6591637.1 capsular polysaccharide biosynthesis protein [Yoonia sp. 1_MG-2023]RBW43752.1 capsular polysaccharide biosynthesis protein [Loktanella sp. D2R18]
MPTDIHEAANPADHQRMNRGHPIALTYRRLAKAGQWLRMMAKRLLPGAHGDLATSMDLCDDPLVARALGRAPVFHSRLIPTRAERYIGWGRKWSGRRAVDIAKQKNATALLLEDGFLRSVGRRDPAISIAIDDLGVHYDASTPSQLEGLIAAPLSRDEQARAQALSQLWRDGRVSKYNAAPELQRPLPTQYVLVVDQVRGDLSIRYGWAKADSFDTMLQRALADNPDVDVVVKLHPDVFTNAAKSHFDPDRLAQIDRVHVIAENCHPVSLISQAKAVYTVTSQVGFEALIWGKPVHTFGMPFYAGWGLTHDALAAPDRRVAASLAQLVHAALIRYVRYVDPITGQICEAEGAITHIAHQRQMRHKLPEQVTAIGFSAWKRQFLPQFFADTAVRFARKAKGSETVAVWGRADAPAGALRIEDGFLRSAGLGADLIRPLSLVIDKTGIYFDATRPSDLENTLNTQELTQSQIARARQLRQNLIADGISKYNSGGRGWTRPDTKKPVVLVVGQVETDASLEYGSPDIKTNLALLQRVRARCPDDYIVYKPHPDVLAGLRDRLREAEPFAAYCDETLMRDIAPDHLLSQIDAVHTMTSLMGFEALVREIPVTCHGIPFYAGWGLTTDTLPAPRRVKHLSLDGLIYGALFTYPRYYDADAGCFVGPEETLEMLKDKRKSGAQGKWFRKCLRMLMISSMQLRGIKK